MGRLEGFGEYIFGPVPIGKGKTAINVHTTLKCDYVLEKNDSGNTTPSFPSVVAPSGNSNW